MKYLGTIDEIEDLMNRESVNAIYKGHVNNASSLPLTGQPSGTLTGLYGNFSTYTYNTFRTPVSNDPLSQYRSYKNYYVEYETMDNYFVGVIVSTDYPEMVSFSAERVTKSSGFITNYFNMGLLNITYDASKPVYYYIPDRTSYGQYYLQGSGKSGSISLVTNTWTQITEDMLIRSLGYASMNIDTHTLQTTQTFANYDAPRCITNFPQLKFTTPTGYSSSLTFLDTLGNPDGSYYYNDGMVLLTCPDGNFANTVFMTGDGSAEEGDLYTVGNYNDIYRLHNSTWEHWSNQASVLATTKLDKVIASSSDGAGSVTIGTLGIEWGTESVTSSSSTSATSPFNLYRGQKDIEFNYTYKNNPVVLIGFAGAYTNQISTNVSSITTTGCTLNAYLTGASSNRTLKYIVIGEKA